VNFLKDVPVFLATHPFHKASYLQGPVWLQTLAYLVDIFSTTNGLSVPGSNIV
jgi:hypothetical protein